MTIPAKLFLLSTLPFAFSSCDSGDSSAQKAPQGKYESHTVVQFHDTDTRFPKSSVNFIANQVAILTTGSVLDEAAKLANLERDTISNSLIIDPIDGTDLVKIHSRNDIKDQPKLILESLTNAYVKIRNQRDLEKTKLLMKALDKELEAQADLTQERRKALTVLIQQYGIPYSYGSQTTPPSTSEEKLYQKAQKKLESLQQDADLLNIQLKKLLTTKSDELIRAAAGLEIPDNQVTFFYQQYRDSMEEKKALMAGGIGPKHPQVQAVSLKAKHALESAKREFETLKDILKVRSKLVHRQIERMSAMISQRGDRPVGLPMNQHQYNEAKEKYEQAQDILRDMKIKQQEAHILLKTPHSPLTIHERPE